jgi:hypothetical protein
MTMIDRLTKILIPGFLAIGLAACGGGGDDAADLDAAAADPDANPPDPDASVDLIGQLFEDLVDTICGKAFECEGTFPGTPTEFTDQFGADEAACITMYTGLIADQVSLYEASVDAGRIAFDNADGQACLAAQAALACDAYWDAPSAPECDTTFIGQVADGDACTIPDDCASDVSGCDGTTMTCTPA